MNLKWCACCPEMLKEIERSPNCMTSCRGKRMSLQYFKSAAKLGRALQFLMIETVYIQLNEHMA